VSSALGSGQPEGAARPSPSEPEGRGAVWTDERFAKRI